MVHIADFVPIDVVLGWFCPLPIVSSAVAVYKHLMVLFVENEGGLFNEHLEVWLYGRLLTKICCYKACMAKQKIYIHYYTHGRPYID